MQRRPLDLRDYDAVAADVEQLARHGYTKAGNWDLCQVCDHLARTMNGSIDGFPFKGPWFLRTFLSGVIRWRILKKRSMPAGFQGPSRLMPEEAGDQEQALKAFNNALARVRDHQGSFHPSPVMNELSPEQWRQFHLIHASHHLSFLIPREAN